MTNQQHKVISALLISAVTFLGFESLAFAAGIYEMPTFFQLAMYITIFHIFWITFVFDLHLKHNEPVNLASAHYRNLIEKALKLRFKHFLNWHYLKHYLNYLILPAILYWSVIILIFINPFKDGFKQILCVVASFALTVVYWHMKEHVSSRLEARHSWLKVLAGIKIFAVFMSYCAIFALAWYSGLNESFVFYFVLCTTFLLIYQALFQFGFNSFGLIMFTLATSAIIALGGVWVYSIWSHDYLSAAIILLAIYNTVWGFIHHYIDKTLNFKIAVEYIVLAILILSLVLATHNFNPRIG